MSTNPITYISIVPKAIQKARGIGADNAKERPTDELKQGVAEWIEKKFDLREKVSLRKRLFPGEWSRELVVNEVKHPEELDLFREAGIKIIRRKDVIREMAGGSPPIKAAAGNGLFTLMQLGTE